ncbi:MAG: ATPase [Candidatus Nanohalarchaeota archaeon]|nr:MAG: ATPase [Candidatus Nanohaloarchaeota archaeon]
MKSKTPDDFLEQFSTSKEGLSESEAKRRLRHYGHNELEQGKKATAISIFLDQFKNALIILLIFACVLSLFLGEKLESFAMFFIIILTAIMGFVQEWRAEKAIEMLKNETAPMAVVCRGGRIKKIPAREVVTGDIVYLEAGDIVCADCKILTLSNLQIDESSLTGESVPVKKIIDLSSSKRESMAFMNSIVTVGKATAVVATTGMKTEIGKIAGAIQETEETKTPLQVKFNQMAKQIGVIVISLIVLVSVSSYLSSDIALEAIIMFALALTVAAVPNSLPVVVTVGLSVGAKQLSGKNMLIKKLTAAESLGATTFICSDKTGTLTKNQMTITHVYTSGRIINIGGEGYEPKGDFYIENEKTSPEKLQLLLRIGYLCNNAKLVKNNGKYEIIGDPTEGALIVLGQKGGIREEKIKKDFEFMEELSFDSDRKRMSSIYMNKSSGKKEVYVKGAPDLLIGLCDRIYEDGKIRKITEKDRKLVLKTNDEFAKKALRILGLAYSLTEYSVSSIEKTEKNLVFIGLVGMIDPPRSEVKESIEQCKTAGIKVMVITGDYSATARAIARQIGLFKEGDLLLSGQEIQKMTDEELEEKIEDIRIIARSQAIQKMRIIDILQKKSHIVAMTGDGVNDAPALKKADIGVAMGITGTEVSKEVSKAILVDDNFSTIVNAVGEGRNIYDKMIKSVRYLLPCNAGEIITMLIAIAFKLPLPLIPLQILLMNLLTDDFPALGLGMEKADDDIMKRKPRNPKEKPITNQMFGLIILFGIIMGIGTVFLFSLYVDENLNKARTVAFTTLVAFEMFAVLSARSLKPSIKKLNPFSNKYLFGAICLSLIIQLVIIYVPFMQMVFETVALNAIDWMRILAVSSIGLIVMEGSKIVLAKINKSEGRGESRI